MAVEEIPLPHSVSKSNPRKKGNQGNKRPAAPTTPLPPTDHWESFNVLSRPQFEKGKHPVPYQP